MSYDVESKKLGRQPISIVEITLDRCANVYGIAPCNASGAQGDECFNTQRTCQDFINYNNSETTVHRFSDVPTPNHHSVITSFELAPVTISPGQAFSKRASIRVRLTDFTDSDLYTDPYVTTRNYNPKTQGTYFGKFLARNPHYQDRPMKLMSGYINDDGGVFTKSQSFIVDKIEGPDAKGRVTVSGKDILKLTDDKRAQCPRPSSGRLTIPLQLASTILLLQGDNSEYLDSEYLRIGTEIIKSPISSRVANGFINLERGSHGTEIQHHDAGTPIQACKKYDNENVINVIQDLLINYADIPSSFIPLFEWEAERDLWLNGHTTDAIITDPVGVNKLLDEIAEEMMVYIWWDSFNQLIRLKSVTPPIGSAKLLSDEFDFVGLPSVKNPVDDRVSRMAIYYNYKTPLKITNADDFNTIIIQADPSNESKDQFGDIRLKRIFSRWIHSDGVALTTVSRTVNRFKDSPRIIEFVVDGKDHDLELGEFVRLQSLSLQSITGDQSPILSQILSIEEIKIGTNYKIIAQEITEISLTEGLARIASNFNEEDYNLASSTEKDVGCYIIPDNLTEFPDGRSPYVIS